MSNAKQYFISGIDTNVGKTLVSTVLVEALKADYWKPIQSGDLDNSDTQKVRNLVSNSSTKFYESTYAFKTPASPHYAAKIDNQLIDLYNFTKNNSSNNLIVEGAGGLMVPLNNQHLLIDLIKHLNLEVVLVIKNYLGSINHSLLSIEILKQHTIPLKGIIFNGEAVASSEEYILQYSGARCLGKIPNLEQIDKETIKQISEQFEFLNYD